MAALAAACLASAVPVSSAEPVGRPAVQRFAADLDVYPRNFSVTQGPSGIVYVGNAEGLLTFDGTRWRLHETNVEEVVRTLAHDGRGRLYVGGYNGFGYFEAPVAPGAEYVDLTARFEIEEPAFADIWQIEVLPEGVFFLALNDLFWLDPDSGETRRWTHEGRFGALGRVHGRIYLQYRGEGFRVWRDGEFEPLPGSAELDEQIYDLLALPGGGFLTTARDGRWRAWRDGRVFDFEVPDGLPASNQLTTSLALEDDLFAFGSVDGWLYFLDPVAGAFDAFQLSQDWVSDMEVSREGGLIAQTDQETLYVRWPAKWTAWGLDHGLGGSVMEVLRWQDRWLVISNSGAFAGSTDGPIAFRSLPWTSFEAWDFEPLGDGTGLLADSYALKHVSLDGVSQTLESVQYPRAILASEFQPDIFYVGTESGISVVSRHADGFELVATVGERFDGVFSMLEIGPRRLLVGSQSDGAVDVRFDESLAGIEAVPVTEGIDYGDATFADVLVLAGEPHALTFDAAWRWTGDGFEPADLGLASIRREGRFLEVRESPSGERWAFDFSSLYRFDGERGWVEMELGSLARGAISSIDFGPDGRALVGATGSVAVYDPDAPGLAYQSHPPRLRSVRLTDETGATRQLPVGQFHAVPAQPMSIRFDYSLPGLNGRDEIRYQARLEGYEPNFTDWEPTSQYTYINLEPGEYAFQVRARDAAGNVSEIDPFEFEIVPPWFQSPWIQNLRWPAIALALVVLIWLYMRARVWRLEAERKRLAEKVRQRTRALVTANRKLKQMAEVDELTGIANRRSFDQYLRQQVAQCHAAGRTLSLALIDLDRFKPYNDRHGHLAGDRVLRDVARCLVEGFGNEDVLVARFGGDEFAAVLPGIDLDAARDKAERSREHCSAACSEIEISVGIAAVTGTRKIATQTLLEAADHQLYEIKRSGRNGIGAAWVESGEG